MRRSTYLSVGAGGAVCLIAAGAIVLGGTSSSSDDAPGTKVADTTRQHGATTTDTVAAYGILRRAATADDATLPHADTGSLVRFAGTAANGQRLFVMRKTDGSLCTVTVQTDTADGGVGCGDVKGDGTKPPYGARVRTRNNVANGLVVGLAPDGVTKVTIIDSDGQTQVVAPKNNVFSAPLKDVKVASDTSDALSTVTFTWNDGTQSPV